MGLDKERCLLNALDFLEENDGGWVWVCDILKKVQGLLSKLIGDLRAGATLEEESDDGDFPGKWVHRKAGMMKRCIVTPAVLLVDSGSDTRVPQQALQYVASDLARMMHDRGHIVKIWNGGIRSSVQQGIERLCEDGLSAKYLCVYVSSFLIQQPGAPGEACPGGTRGDNCTTRTNKEKERNACDCMV